MPGKPGIVMAWDPGGTTGVCVAAWNRQTPGTFKVLYDNVVLWPTRLRRIRELIDEYEPETTITESFRLYESKAKDQIGADFPSCQVIGIIEAYLYMTGLNLPIYQPAAIISGKPPVQILLEHQPLLHHSEHGRDSYKHARYWIAKQHTKPVKVLR